MDTIVKNVEVMINKAAAAQDSGDAMRFAQAALNAANAAITLANAKREAAKT